MGCHGHLYSVMIAFDDNQSRWRIMNSTLWKEQTPLYFSRIHVNSQIIKENQWKNMIAYILKEYEIKWKIDDDEIWSTEIIFQSYQIFKIFIFFWNWNESSDTTYPRFILNIQNMELINSKHVKYFSVSISCDKFTIWD